MFTYMSPLFWGGMMLKIAQGTPGLVRAQTFICTMHMLENIILEHRQENTQDGQNVLLHPEKWSVVAVYDYVHTRQTYRGGGIPT